ncbi:MAG: cell division protein FtsA [Chitinispirillales bacterium]|jgi:cell division protein FtsA|nr:cell division protein FtsA [Chitinispirillales bacterium]
MENEVFVGLDIGTTKVACIIAEPDENNLLRIIGVGVSPSDGLRKGTVVNIDRTVNSIKKAVEEAELMAGVDVNSVWVGIAGDHIRGKNGNGPVAIARENPEITQEDIDRAIGMAKATQFPPDCELLHVIPQGYSVDDQKKTDNPLGMRGVKLEAEVHIITGQSTVIQDIKTCVEKAGLRLIKLVFEPLASSNAVLNKDEKELGVALIDIGGGTTDIAVYTEEHIRYIAAVGVGGKNVTNDIAIGLRTPLEKAEEVKRKYGNAYQPLLRGENERFMVPAVGGNEDREVGREVLVGIIEPRVEEILTLALREIKKSGYQQMLGAGVVLTGGGALMEGAREKAEEVFQMPVKIGIPGRFSGLTEAVKSPIHATGIGLCMFAAESRREVSEPRPGVKGDSLLGKIVTWIKKYL